MLRRPLAALLAALLAAPAAAAGSASAAPADAVRQQELWVLNALDVAGAWQTTQGHGVTVALIDSGVNGQVSDLAGSVIPGRDFTGVNTPPANPSWGVHGTWMASLIVGHGHPAGGPDGIEGVAPAAAVLSIRAVTDKGDPGYRRYERESERRVQARLAAAIRYATSKHVRVISMSLGYQGASRTVREAISGALAQGIVVVASSGNSGGTPGARHGSAPYSFPADYPGVLGVGAVSQTGQPAGFSSDNLSVQVAAPGVRVPAQGRDGQYWLVSGTSPACALTAGVAALIKSRYPALAPALVVQAITATTANKPPGGYDQEVGFGTVDATAALKMAGRLARDQDTGRGLVAAAQFGGGPAAVPPVPVAPRGGGQRMIDTLVALACLALAAVCAVRLIGGRRVRAAAAGPAPAPAWPGSAPQGGGAWPGSAGPVPRQDGPPAGSGMPGTPDAGGAPGRTPFSDDDTWPNSGQW
jgi:subtilisin family serine protease